MANSHRSADKKPCDNKSVRDVYGESVDKIVQGLVYLITGVKIA